MSHRGIFSKTHLSLFEQFTVLYDDDDHDVYTCAFEHFGFSLQ